MGNLQAFFYPKEAVNVGSKWETIVKGDKEKGSVDLKATFEILAREKVGTHECFKVAIESKEQAGDEPAGSKGFAWVEITTGSVVKAEGEWTNVLSLVNPSMAKSRWKLSTSNFPTGAKPQNPSLILGFYMCVSGKDRLVSTRFSLTSTPLHTMLLVIRVND